MRATGKLRVFGKATEEKISKKNTKRYMILHKFGYVLCREPDKEERRKCVRQADGGGRKGEEAREIDGGWLILKQLEIHREKKHISYE